MLGLRNLLQSKAVFWQMRRFWENAVIFNLFKQFYRTRFHHHEEKISARILRKSLGSVLLNGLYAAFFIAILELLYHLFPLKSSIAISEERLGLLISTVVTVSGVFLGLYFTAVSVVAGNLFMRATDDLQELFIRERKGQQYIRTLVLTTLIGVFYLLLRTFDYAISPLGPIVIAILAMYAIIRFMFLGFQTFYFLHPIEASATITGDTAYAIRNSTAKGFGWEKPYLQNHYRKRAEYTLNTLQSLISFGLEVVRLSVEQLVAIARYAGGLLDYYLERKKRIPTESYWYKTKAQFQKWIFASSTEVTMALNTGTALSPKNIKDKLWFEEKCLQIILRLFNYFVEKKQRDSAHVCVEIVVSVAEKMGADLYDDVARMVIDQVGSAIERAVSSSTESGPEDRKGRLALIDSYGRLGISALIGLSRHLDKRDASRHEAEIRSIDWSKESSIYESKLPGKLLSSLESTARKYQAEMAIEGKAISPEWYLVTITTQQYLLELKRYFDFVKSLHENLFERNVEVLIKAKQILLATHLVQRWLEFTNKFGACGTRFEKLVKDCAPLQYVKDLPWIEIDFAKERDSFESMDKEAVDKLIQLLPVLSQLPEPEVEELPDYFGQAYTFGVEACYQACLENDADRFKKIYPVVFLGSLSAHDTTRRRVEGWTQDSQIIFSSEPLEDLLNLSGYAKLYAELYQNNDLWKVCEETWNNYLSNPGAKDIIGLIVAVTEYRDSKFVIMPKAVLRVNWDIKFRSKLREMNLIRDRFEEHMTGRDEIINHPSPIIRIVGRYGDLLPADARNIFFVTYLSQHQSAQGIEFPDRRDLKRQIERESNQRPEEDI